MKARSRNILVIVVVALMASALVAIAPVSAATPAGGAASTDWFRWNWQNPLPQGNYLDHAWGADANHVWVAGGSGTVLMWNGFNWLRQPTGVTDGLSGMSGVDPQHVWATGENGTVLFYNGRSWSPQESHTTKYLSGVNALDESHVWAVGDSGEIRFFNGTNWSHQASGTTSQMYGISAVDSHHVWAAGRGGTILFYNGTTWAPQASGTIEDFLALFALDSHHVWAVGFNGTVRFFNGTTWSGVAAGTTANLGAVWALDTHHVWISGLNGTIRFFNGSTWKTQGSGLTENFLSGLFALDESNAWAFGENGTMLAYDGSDWVARSSGTEPGEGLLQAVSASDPKHVWAAGGTFMSATGGFILFYDGTSWKPQKTNLPYNLADISALDAEHVWACGGPGKIIFFNGSTWTPQASGTTDFMTSISAADAKHVWAGTDNGRILFFNGTAWHTQANLGPLFGLNGISALDAHHVWAVGSQGRIWFYNGTSWTTQANLGATVSLNRVRALDEHHVWAVGANGLVKFFNGSSWKTQATGVTSYIADVTATDAHHAWAVCGGDASILFFNGSSWSPQASPVDGSFLRGVTSLDKNHVWAVGVGTNVLFGSSEATDWDLAEGATQGGFETWILVQNPGDKTAKAHLSYMTPTGEQAGPDLTLAPGTRQSVNVGDTVTDFSVSTRVTSDNPVVCERAMYFDNRVGGHGSVGTTSPARTWFLAEGATAGGFETWVLVQNPGDKTATAQLTYLTGGGEKEGPELTLAPHTRQTVNVAETVANDFNVSTLVTSNHPVVAERATYWNNRTAGQESIGVTNPAQRWFLAEGSTKGGFETWVLLENPGTLTAHAELTFMTPTGEVPGPDVTLAPRTRQTVEVSKTVPDNWSVSTTVTSDQPLVAERAMYWNNRAGGHDSVGVTEASDKWYMAEGVTAAPFETWILVQNPGSSTAKAKITYMTNSGEVPGPTLTLPAHSRQTVNVAETVANDFNVATRVESDKPVVAERATYWNNRTQDGTESIGFTPR